jgi:hypothetical protein
MLYVNSVYCCAKISYALARYGGAKPVQLQGGSAIASHCRFRLSVAACASAELYPFVWLVARSLCFRK